jgi:cholesterol oxidase
MRERYDAVVIGSGFGGAVAACRLAQAGRSVCVLERGRRWHKSEFPRTTGQVAQAFWDEGRADGFLEYRTFRRVDVIQGAGVGGGSLHYFNVRLRAPESIFRTPAWPEAITRRALDVYYDLAQSTLEAEPLRPPEGFGRPRRTEAFLAAAARSGRRAELLDIAVHTGPDRAAPAGSPMQSACVYCGNCLLGCHVFAKNTLDLNYLALAEQRNGAEIHPLHLATSIAPEPGGGYRVGFRRLGPESGAGSVVGRVVVLTAGSLGSTELLLRCRDELRTLPSLSRALGTRFSTNGDLIFAGALDADRPVDPGHGPSITAMVDCSTPRHRITIEDLGFPDPLLWYLEGVLPSGRRLRNALELLKSYVRSTLGFGSTSSRVSLELERLFQGGRTTRFLPYLGMGTDASDGVLRLRGGRLDLVWSHRRSREMFREMEQAMDELSRAIGARYVTSVLWRWPLRKLLTAHPLGGCVLGDRAEHSVLDPTGQVWGHPGLYVLDGAAVPSALAVNPSLTISALAERSVFWMLHGREMRPDDRPSP